MYLGWLPSYGRGTTVQLGWWSTGLLSAAGLKAIILQAVTLSLFQVTLIMRLVRSEMLEVLRTDYIKFARARGLPDRAVHFGHALRNTLIPVHHHDRIAARHDHRLRHRDRGPCSSGRAWGCCSCRRSVSPDIPLMAAYLLLIALVFVTINLVVDLLYYAVDPRLRVDSAA